MIVMSMVLTCNIMISSELWARCYSCCIAMQLMVFVPSFTAILILLLAHVLPLGSYDLKANQENSVASIDQAEEQAEIKSDKSLQSSNVDDMQQKLEVVCYILLCSSNENCSI